MKMSMVLWVMMFFSGLFAQEGTKQKQLREYSSIHPMLVEIKRLFEEKKYQQAFNQQQEVFCVIDKYLPEEEKSFRRLISYTMPLSLLRKKDMIEEDRVRILNYALRGFSDSKISHNDKNRLSRSIMQYILENDIDAENHKLISFAFQDKVADNRYFIELVYMAHIEGCNEYIEDLSSKKISFRNIDSIKESGAWGAKLILAKTMRGKYIDNVLHVISNIDDEWKRIILLEDLESIKDEKVIFFLVPFLNSNQRMPQLKPALPGEFYARRAALVLKKMLVGFPAGNYYDLNDIMLCREWLSKQTIFQFKDQDQ